MTYAFESHPSIALAGFEPATSTCKAALPPELQRELICTNKFCLRQTSKKCNKCNKCKMVGFLLASFY